MSEDIAALRLLLSYNALTGVLTWNERPAATAKARSWNTRYAGRPALAVIDKSNGYCTGSINGKKALAHRVAYALVHGAWPVGDVDHINGNRSDNRIRNLRDVSRRENCRNRRLDARSSTGLPGVRRRRSRWIAEIGREGTNKYIGSYSTAEEASAAWAAEAARLGYHPNHGRKAHV